MTKPRFQVHPIGQNFALVDASLPKGREVIGLYPSKGLADRVRANREETAELEAQIAAEMNRVSA